MPTTYLIDGYNLIHALGFLHPEPADRALERSRQRLLQFLLDELGDGPARTIVVFDAGRLPRRGRSLYRLRSIEIHFAVDHASADDLIEALIQAHPAPRSKLAVVSNDHRLLDAARRAAAGGLSCSDFLDQLEAAPRRAPAPRPPEKADPSPAEIELWLEEFRDLAHDPGFKELFDPYPFEDA
jgi:predicted RNA-binding protein with PIN domain